MANRLVVLHKEFGPLLNALGKKLAPSGKKSIMDMKDAHRIEFGLALTDNKKFKKLKDDRLLKKLMKNKTDGDFKTTLKKIAKIVENETKAFHMSTKVVSPGDWGPIRETHSKNAWEQTKKELTLFSKKANSTWNITLEKYYDERQEGKHEKSKERVNKVKGVAGAAVSLAGVGMATAGTIATFGAAAPGLAAASYGSYLACKDAFDLFRKSGKSIDARRESIFKQVAVIEKDYLGAKNRKAMQDAMKKREIKAKAMRTFLSVNSKTSLKKLGGDLAALEKALKMSKFSLSKVGKKSGEHVNRLDKVIEYCARIEKSTLASEIKTITKAIKKEKLSKELLNDTEKLKATAIYQKKLAKDYVTVTIKSYQGLNELGSEIPEWKNLVDELNAERPAAVKNASTIFKGMKIAFQVGAAASSMGASAASFVPDGAKFAIKSASGLKDVGQTIVETAQAIESEYSLTKKAGEKLAKKMA